MLSDLSPPVVLVPSLLSQQRPSDDGTFSTPCLFISPDDGRSVLYRPRGPPRYQHDISLDERALPTLPSLPRRAHLPSPSISIRWMSDHRHSFDNRVLCRYRSSDGRRVGWAVIRAVEVLPSSSDYYSTSTTITTTRRRRVVIPLLEPYKSDLH